MVEEFPTRNSHDLDNYDIAYVLWAAEAQRSEYLPRRVASEYIWKRLASGTLPSKETEMWAQIVAKKLVDGVISPSRLDRVMRGRAALSAIGLEGQMVKYSQIQADLETFFELANRDFDDLIADKGSSKGAKSNPIVNSPTPSQVVERYGEYFQGISKHSDKLSEASKMITKARELVDAKLARAARSHK